MTRMTLADGAAGLLAEHRALPSEELGRALAERGLTRARSPAQAVSRALGNDPRFCRLTDDRWAVPGQLLEGAAFTHRLTPEEVERGVLPLDPDLAPLVALARVGLSLPDDRPVTFLFDASAREATGLECDAALAGPDGWLDQLPGSLLIVRAEAGRLDVRPGPKPAAESRLVLRRVTEAVRARLAQPGIPFLPRAVGLETLVLDLLADDPALLGHPVAPLGEALVAAGLEVHRGFVGLPGTDWASFDELMSFEDDEDWDDGIDFADGEDSFGVEPDEDGTDSLVDEEFEAATAALGLDPREADGLRIVMGAFDLHQRLGGLEEGEALANLAQIVAIPVVAQLLAIRAWTEPALESFAAAVARSAGGPYAAGVDYVLATCAEARDDAAGAEVLLRSALTADPGFVPALVGLARYAEDRGDYPTALRYLRSAGAPADQPQRAWIEAILPPALPKVGRNEPCPCGSGRKYKACHLGRPDDVSVDIAGALLHKVSMWLRQPDNQRLLDEISRLALIGEPDRDPEELLDQPLLSDIVLFDRGQLRRFLDVRGFLLPEPELALGRSWLGSRRSLYEVQVVRPGSSVTLKDLLGGEIAELGDRTISRRVEPLDLLCLRLYPDGAGGIMTAGGMGVPRLRRSQVADLIRSGDGLGLLRWFVGPGPRTEMRNTEGETLLFVIATYRIPDPGGLSQALGRKLHDDGTGRFVETVTRRGEDWLRGSIRLEGDRATVEANSAKRAARLERMLLRAAPGARLLRREERSLEEAIEERQNSGEPPEGPIDLNANPEAAAALQEFLRGYEERWIDEPVPALKGLSPRQALADESARPELEALLDDIEWQQRRAGASAGGKGMDASHLRRLLGLGQRVR